MTENLKPTYEKKSREDIVDAYIVEGDFDAVINWLKANPGEAVNFSLDLLEKNEKYERSVVAQLGMLIERIIKESSGDTPQKE